MSVFLPAHTASTRQCRVDSSDAHLPAEFEQLAGAMHVSGTIEHPAERVEQQRARQWERDVDPDAVRNRGQLIFKRNTGATALAQVRDLL